MINQAAVSKALSKRPRKRSLAHRNSTLLLYFPLIAVSFALLAATNEPVSIQNPGALSAVTLGTNEIVVEKEFALLQAQEDAAQDEIAKWENKDPKNTGTHPADGN